MKWYVWVAILCILLVIALLLTLYFKSRNEQKDKQQKITGVPAWLLAGRVVNNMGENKDLIANEAAELENNVNINDVKDVNDSEKSKENYINFTFSTVSDFSEAKALQMIANRHPSSPDNPKLLSKAIVINRLNYVHDYENRVAISNTQQIFNDITYTGSKAGKYINLNYIENSPLTCFGVVLQGMESINFYVDTKASFTLFQAEGLLTVSMKEQLPLVPSNNTGIYNIVGQDIHQLFIITEQMTDITFLFLGNLLSIKNNSKERYYGLIMVKPIMKNIIDNSLKYGGGVATNILTDAHPQPLATATESLN